MLRGYQSDFAQLTAEVVDHTLEAAGLGGAQIGVIHVADIRSSGTPWVPCQPPSATTCGATCAPPATTARRCSVSSWRRRAPGGSRMTDGRDGVVLGVRPPARIDGWGHRTVSLVVSAWT
ncbi:hypothetical protein MTOK_26840 [Mycolicibacterium tokaiense]|nr:hypothetical protein MTOK_26840 [Mycolicibacterium tokaiense]